MKTRHVARHGEFTVESDDLRYALSLPRRTLVRALAGGVYDPSMGEGSKISHWKKYSKEDIAYIYADTTGRGMGHKAPKRKSSHKRSR